MVSSDILGTLTSRLAGASVLCLGDAILDRFIYGDVERISPEAPIPILKVERHDLMLGGAGNVAANTASLGAKVTLVALAGDDAPAAALRDLAAAFATLELRLTVDPSRPTPEKSRFIANRQQLLRTDAESAVPVQGEAANLILADFEAALPDAGAVVLSDYGKGVLSDEVLKQAIGRARELGIPVIVDPKRQNWQAYAGASVITPNRNELSQAAGMPTDDDAEVAAAAEDIMNRVAVDALLVTRAEKGVSLMCRGQDAIHIPTRAQEVFDVSGAGDTVVAMVATALAVGGDLAEASALANLAGGIVVGKLGTAVIGTDDLVQALRGQRVGSSEAKLANRDEIIETVQQWRGQGLRIGFTNGCFDLLHPGHVSLMRQAAAACDRLVVGLNSDASVRRLKGDDRPIQGEIARAIVLASLEDVDLVTIFAEDTPLDLIRLLQPDVLVKGADYAKDAVVGAEDVEGWGGEVLLAALEEGNSTSGTIERMRGAGGKSPE